jgi:hypothetical protein
MEPWKGMKVAPPTPASIRRIEAELGIEIPESLREFALRSRNFGAWFAGLGEDYDNSFHILGLNQVFHQVNRKHPHVRMPPHLVLINHGHDGDCDCFDLQRPRGANGEYSIRYWTEWGGDWALYPSLLAYVEDFLNPDRR